MIKKLKQTNILQTGILAAGVSAFGIAMVIFRIYRTDSMHFMFLIWNLFLAGIPWLISSLLILYPGLRKRIIILLIAGGIWLLFIPNSFYIITDLFYLKYKNLAPIWYDLVLIFTFAWAGIILGFSSFKDVEDILTEKIGKKFTIILTSFLLFLISFGIYLGRFLRWNSWNIINEPKELLSDISERITNPFEHPSLWGMTILTGILLNFIWWSFKVFRKNSLSTVKS